MAKIQKLNEHLTNMIAAGEVVERPMGVVKELVENSIDAHADRIGIRIIEGGTQLIEVSDNGSGMDSQDAVFAFNRHSTSKISLEQDLWHIHSLGFRGEALPSIASVSKTVCLTNDGTDSTQVTIAFGQLQEAKKSPANQGTTIRVQDLFQRTPARLKHLRSVQYESSLILDVVQKFALGYPDIAFTLYVDQKPVFQSSGNGDMIELMYLIYGNEIARKAILITGEDYDFKLSGVMVLPQFTRSTRYSITTFINHRMIRYPKLQNAIKEGYKRHIPSDRYPIVVLNIDLDEQLVDVNVHPSKWEVRLSKEKQLIELIVASLEKTLADQMRANTLPEKTLEKTIYYQQESLETLVQEPQSSPFISKAAARKEEREEPAFSYRPQPMQTSEPEPALIQEPAVAEAPVQPNSELSSIRVLAQMHGKYILGESPQGLYIFDQHASMERIRYEYYQHLLLDKPSDRQTLLIPLVFDGHAQIVQQIDAFNELLERFDVQVEALSTDQVILREVPLWMKDTDLKETFEEIMERFQSDQHQSLESFRRLVIATLACHSSIRFNQHLSQAEMEKLVHDLSLCEQPYNCPHGRPTFMLLAEKDLEKTFLR